MLKISASTFDGDILNCNWIAFGEQFEVALHKNERLHNTQNIVYLREAVKNGPTKQVIEARSFALVRKIWKGGRMSL